MRVLDRNTGQQRWNKRTAYSSRFALLSATAQAHFPRGGTTHTELGPPTSIKKMSSQACLHTNLKDTLSQLRFFFPNNSSLCQVDKKQTINKPGQQKGHTKFFLTTIMITEEKYLTIVWDTLTWNIKFQVNVHIAKGHHPHVRKQNRV